MDTVLQLNGTGIMFWGGKEGYQCMADTNLRLELDNRAEYIRKTIEYATLGYEKNHKGDLQTDNKRNGHSTKNLKRSLFPQSRKYLSGI